jgi:hypothetical protein
MDLVTRRRRRDQALARAHDAVVELFRDNPDVVYDERTGCMEYFMRLARILRLGSPRLSFQVGLTDSCED